MLISNLPSAGRSHQGSVRGSNGDQFVVADLNRVITIHGSSLPVEAETRLFSGVAGQLLVVADGISGQPGSTIASQIGVGTVARYVLNAMPWFLSLNHDHDNHQQEHLLAAVSEVQSAIVDEAGRSPEFNGMGTTLTMAYIMWPRLFVVNVGDSRCYLLRSGELQQLTRDQTVAQEMVDLGELSQARSELSPLRKVLVSSAGQDPAFLHPEVSKTELKAGDRILVCTNGLTSQVSDSKIAAILGEAATPDAACSSLVATANEAGGADNVTVTVAFGRPPVERPTKPRSSVGQTV